MKLATPISTTTSTITVNRAFLQEIKEVNQELWEILASVRYSCSRPISIRTQSRPFVEQLAELRDQLALHFALEEAYGYFEDPAWVAPQLCQTAEQLRSEHGELYVQITDLVEKAELYHRKGMVASLITEIVADFEAFDEAFQTHEDREQEMILAQYDDDIGVGD